MLIQASNDEPSVYCPDNETVYSPVTDTQQKVTVERQNSLSWNSLIRWIGISAVSHKFLFFYLCGRRRV